MRTLGVILVCLTFGTGTLAEICYRTSSNICCLFGCCSNTFYDYTFCCVSNGIGIGIIVGLLILIAVPILCCIRLRLRERRRVANTYTTCPLDSHDVTHNLSSEGYISLGDGKLLSKMIRSGQHMVQGKNMSPLGGGVMDGPVCDIMSYPFVTDGPKYSEHLAPCKDYPPSYR